MFSSSSKDSSFNSSSNNPFSALFGGGGGGQFGQGLGSLFGGLFGNGGKPYEDAMKQFQKYFNQGSEYQKPFYEAGKGAIPDFQNWLKGMSDPSDFLNNIIGQYSESPQTKYLQDQAMKAGTNAGSASGLSGSTPLMQQMQQNAGDIASGGLNDWLSNVLGVNNKYGEGLGNLMGSGQNAGNQLTELFKQLGQLMGEGKYGSGMADNKQKGDIWGGLGNIIGSFF